LAALINATAAFGEQVSNGGSSPGDILYARPAKLVSINGFRLNLFCLGSGSPTVVFGGNHGVPAEAPDRANYELEITHAQARWLALSSNSKQIFAHSNSEYIQFDDRETVITAIR
jgi:hypothetical protein